MAGKSLSKKDARLLAKRLRKDMPLSEKEALDRMIYMRLLDFLEDQGAFRYIFSYVSCDGEVDTRHFLEYLLTGGYDTPGIRPEGGEIIAAPSKAAPILAVPRVRESSMEFFELSSMDELHTGFAGIPEPDSKAALIDPGRSFDEKSRTLMIMPGLAFTRKGSRLGYGGGYFDRYLALHPVTVKAALCYSRFLFDDFEESSADIRPDCIITESEVIRISF